MGTEKSRTSPLQAGYTLVELIITITIIAVIAAIAMPAFSSGSDKRLHEVANEFAAAMRFARTESIRTGEPHGFRFMPSQDRIRVFTADTTTLPWSRVYDIYHPISKQPFDYTFPADLVGTNPPISRTPVYRGTCDKQSSVYFDTNGTPWCLDPATILLESYRLDFTIDNEQITVSVDGITGRVTVQ